MTSRAGRSGTQIAAAGDETGSHTPQRNRAHHLARRSPNVSPQFQRLQICQRSSRELCLGISCRAGCSQASGIPPCSFPPTRPEARVWKAQMCSRAHHTSSSVHKFCKFRTQLLPLTRLDGHLGKDFQSYARLGQV